MSSCKYTVSERGFAEVIIDNPPMNVLNSEVLNDIEKCLLRTEQDETVKVILLHGEGKTFVAGADIKEIASIENADDGRDLAKKGQYLFNRIEQSTKPWIALVHGYALGGGLELALACHMRLGAESAKFGFPEINLGLIPGFGGTQRSSRIIGTALALEMILTGEYLDADECIKRGLINRVFPDATFLQEGKKFAEVIAAKGSLAISGALKAAMKSRVSSFDQGLELESEIFGKLCETNDKKEGVSAFLEKRTPRFTNS